MLDYVFGPEPILAVQHAIGPAWATPFAVVTYLGSVAALVALVALAFWLGGRRLAYSIIVLILMGAAVNMLLWNTLGVPRPDDPRIVIRDRVTTPSFPSGHVTYTTVLWGSLAVARFIPWAAFAFVVVVAMISRLYLGAHFLADVVVGMALGLLLLTLTGRVARPLAERIARLPVWTFGAFALVAAVGAFLAVPAVRQHPHVENWQGLGLALGGASGLALERWMVRYAPLESASRLGRVLLGLGGLCLILGGLFAASGGRPEGPAIAMAAGLGALWALVGAPLVFVRLGLGQRVPVGEL